MSLSDNAKPGRRAVLAGMGAAASTAVLAACGFSPAYGPNGIGTRLRNQIVADAPDSRTEYAFVAQLEDRLGRNLSAPYALRYALTTSEDGVAITADGWVAVTDALAWANRGRQQGGFDEDAVRANAEEWGQRPGWAHCEGRVGRSVNF